LDFLLQQHRQFATGVLAFQAPRFTAERMTKGLGIREVLANSTQPTSHPLAVDFPVFVPSYQR
jgi:hypothetical protein